MTMTGYGAYKKKFRLRGLPWLFLVSLLQQSFRAAFDLRQLKDGPITSNFPMVGVTPSQAS